MLSLRTKKGVQGVVKIERDKATRSLIAEACSYFESIKLAARCTNEAITAIDAFVNACNFNSFREFLLSEKHTLKGKLLTLIADRMIYAFDLESMSYTGKSTTFKGNSVTVYGRNTAQWFLHQHQYLNSNFVETLKTIKDDLTVISEAAQLPRLGVAFEAAANDVDCLGVFDTLASGAIYNGPSGTKLKIHKKHFSFTMNADDFSGFLSFILLNKSPSLRMSALKRATNNTAEEV